MNKFILFLIAFFFPLCIKAQFPYSQNESPVTIQKRITPQLLADDLEIAVATTAAAYTVRIAYDHATEKLYYLNGGGDIVRVRIGGGLNTPIQTSNNHGISSAMGFDFSSDGKIFVVGNIETGNYNQGIIKRGEKIAGDWVWETVAETEPYPLSREFDHIFNGIAVSPDDKYLYLNSGSRTDHGELEELNGEFPGLREDDITSMILRVPADSTNITLKNDADYLKENGYWFADGTRNTFDLAFNAEGDLFGTENSSDRDDPEELNWLREGHFYGFPWKIGTNFTPMQYSGYNPDEDLLVNPNSKAYKDGLYYNDPNYPAPPEGLVFTDPIMNYGPDADNFRDSEDGEIKDASDLGIKIGTFTSHRSPLGLIFDTTDALGKEYTGDGFMLGWTGTDSELLAPMQDEGEDLFHLEFTKTEDNYEITTTRIARGFNSPVDAEIIGNKIYILEYGANANIWEITLPEFSTGIDPGDELPESFTLSQNYPNPFNPETTINFDLKHSGFVELEVTDVLGKKVATLVNRTMTAQHYSFRFDASSFSSGIYLYSLKVDGVLIQTRKMLLLK